MGHAPTGVVCGLNGFTAGRRHGVGLDTLDSSSASSARKLVSGKQGGGNRVSAPCQPCEPASWHAAWRGSVRHNSAAKAHRAPHSPPTYEPSFVWRWRFGPLPNEPAPAPPAPAAGYVADRFGRSAMLCVRVWVGCPTVSPTPTTQVVYPSHNGSTTSVALTQQSEPDAADGRSLCTLASAGRRAKSRTEFPAPAQN